MESELGSYRITSSQQTAGDERDALEMNKPFLSDGFFESYGFKSDLMVLKLNGVYYRPLRDTRREVTLGVVWDLNRGNPVSRFGYLRFDCSVSRYDAEFLSNNDRYSKLDVGVRFRNSWGQIRLHWQWQDENANQVWEKR